MMSELVDKMKERWGRKDERNKERKKNTVTEHGLRAKFNFRHPVHYIGV